MNFPHQIVRRLQDWVIIIGWIFTAIGVIVYLSLKGAEVNAATIHVSAMAAEIQADHEKIIELRIALEDFKDQQKVMERDIKELLRRWPP